MNTVNTSSAQQSIETLFNFIITVINEYLVPLVFALAFICFLFGAFQFFILSRGNEEKVKQGKDFMIWSVVGFVVMFSVWGIVNLVRGTLPLNGSQPQIPTLNTSTSGSGSGSFGSGGANPGNGTSGGINPGGGSSGGINPGDGTSGGINPGRGGADNIPGTNIPSDLQGLY